MSTSAGGTVSKPKKTPTLRFAILVICILSLFMATGVGVLKLHVSLILFLSWLVVAPFTAYLGYTFAEMEDFAYDMGKATMAPAFVISAAIYTAIGHYTGESNYDSAQVNAIIDNLNAMFKIDLVPVIPAGGHRTGREASAVAGTQAALPLLRCHCGNLGLNKHGNR